MKNMVLMAFLEKFTLQNKLNFKIAYSSFSVKSYYILNYCTVILSFEDHFQASWLVGHTGLT